MGFFLERRKRWVFNFSKDNQYGEGEIYDKLKTMGMFAKYNPPPKKMRIDA